MSHMRTAALVLGFAFCLSSNATAGVKGAKRTPSSVSAKAKQKLLKHTAKRNKTKASKTKLKKLSNPTHFAYQQSRDASRALTGWIAFPKSLDGKTRKIIAEFGPNRLYNQVYVQAKTLADGDFEISATNRVTGRAGIAPVVITGSKSAKNELLTTFAKAIQQLAASEHQVYLSRRR